jgi:DNA-binding transcriptional LysR family regulator
VWTPDKPEVDVRHHWTEDMVWGKSPNLMLDPAQPVPLVTRGSEWLNHQLAVSALERAGRRYEVVLVAPTILSLMTAVREGLGVMPFGRRRILNTDMDVCDESELPKLPAMGCSIYVSDVGDTEMLHKLADLIADVIRPASIRLAPDDPETGALVRDLLDPPATLPP